MTGKGSRRFVRGSELPRDSQLTCAQAPLPRASHAVQKETGSCFSFHPVLSEGLGVCAEEGKRTWGGD